MATLQSPVFEVSVGGTFNSIHSLMIPMEIAKPFLDAGHTRVKVEARFEEKSIAFHAALMKRKGTILMMFSKNHQKTLGIFPNDYFEMQLFEDTSKYGVELSEEFEAVMMSDYDAFQQFETLSIGKQRGLIYAIGRYKNSQTRIDKTLILCENLKRGIRDPRQMLKPL